MDEKEVKEMREREGRKNREKREKLSQREQKKKGEKEEKKTKIVAQSSVSSLNFSALISISISHAHRVFFFYASARTYRGSDSLRDTEEWTDQR